MNHSCRRNIPVPWSLWDMFCWFLFLEKNRHKSQPNVGGKNTSPSLSAWVCLGTTPHPVRVTTRNIQFLVGNPELNLHLWLASWVGGRPKVCQCLGMPSFPNSSFPTRIHGVFVGRTPREQERRVSHHPLQMARAVAWLVFNMRTQGLDEKFLMGFDVMI